jgi:hypothetical protein
VRRWLRAFVLSLVKTSDSPNHRSGASLSPDASGKLATTTGSLNALAPESSSKSPCRSFDRPNAIPYPQSQTN